MVYGVASVISARGKRLSSVKGKIEELKEDIRQIKKAEKTMINANFLKKLDREIFGYYQFEDMEKKQRKKSIKRRLKIIDRLKKGGKLTYKEKYELL